MHHIIINITQCTCKKIPDIPHKPSFTLDEGMFNGLNPAFVQWNIPLEQAEVPKGLSLEF